MMSYTNCLEVSAQCPVTATALGYAPSLPGNATLLAVFSLVVVAQLIQGIGWKTWGFMTAFVFGSLIEVIGYSGRLMLHSNPWSQSGLVTQMFCLTVGPIFYSAGIYLCYSHLVESFKPTTSRIHSTLYPWISASTNILPFIFQANGSILEANAIRTGSDPKSGTHLTIAGLVFQIFTMLLFGGLCLEFGVRAHLERHFFDPSTGGLRSLKRFRYFWVALAYAYVLTMIRCIYRVVELSGGVNGTLARKETTFIALEGVMVLAVGYAMSLIHPGYVFRAKREGNEKILSDDEKSIL